MSGPFLQVTTPHLQGMRIPVGTGATTIGRGDGASTILGDPSVSRRHAVIEVHGGQLMVRDLNSSNGTYLNGTRVSGPVPVRADDVLLFGNVETHLVTAAAAAPAFHVRDQYADRISNVNGNQYNYEIQRESFLAEIAARRTWGRWLVTLGFLLNFAGFGLFAYGVVDFIQVVVETDVSAPPPEMPSPFGPDVNGVPLGVIGFAVAAVGGFLLVAGFVFHVSAAARRRQLEQSRHR